MINVIIKSVLICLILTIIIELLVAIILGIKDKRDLINIVLINALTNPILNVILALIYYKYGLIWRKICLIFLELLIFLGEGLFYYKVLRYKKINHYLLSLILNLSSYFIGSMILKLIHY